MRTRTPGEPEPSDLEQAAEPEPLSTYYGSADEWFRQYWRYTYRRRLSRKGSGTGRWCADWWINHADPQMAALLAIDGCFADSSDENLPGEPLPYVPPPIRPLLTRSDNRQLMSRPELLPWRF